MRLYVFLPMIACLMMSSARADGPTALELQELLKAGASSQTQNSVAIHDLQQAMLATQSVASAAVIRSGGDVSQTLVQIPSNNKSFQSVSHPITDKFIREYDPRDFGATGDAILLPLTAAAAAGTNTLQFSQDARILDPAEAGVTGQYVGQIGIPASTRVASISISSGVTVVTMTNPLTSSLVSGALICLAVHDDQPAFQAAEVAAFHANNNTGRGVLLAGHGVYYLGSDVSNQGEVNIRLEGARVFGAFIGGGGDSIGVQQGGTSDVRLFATSTQVPTNIYFGEMDMSPAPIGLAGTQKAVFNATIRTSDVQNAAIGYYAKPSFVGLAQGAQEWAFQTQVRVPTATDGYALIMEGGIENSGAYQPEYGGKNAAGFSNAKLGTHVGCGGLFDCTAAHVVAGFGAKWHYGLWFQPGSIRTDGYAVALANSSGGLYASIDGTGNLIAQRGAFSGGLSGYVYLNTGAYLGTGASGTGTEADLVGVGGLNLYGAAPASSLSSGVLPAIIITTDQSARIIATPVTTQTGSYIIAPDGRDCGTTIRAASPNSAVYTIIRGLPIGCRIEIMQAGAGQVSFIGGSGEAIEAINGATKISGQFGVAQLFVDTVNSISLSGQVQ